MRSNVLAFCETIVKTDKGCKSINTTAFEEFRCLVIGDCHFPFANRKSLDRIYGLTAQTQPTHIVQIGDLYDAFSFSRFPHGTGKIEPAAEVQDGRFDAMKMWQTLRKLAPGAICHQLIGNHDSRFEKIIFEKAPQLEFLIPSIRALFEFPGVITQEAENQELMINDICFMHGWRKHSDHVKNNMNSTVCGHSHTGGVAYIRIGNRVHWELNAGFIGDPNAMVFDYRKQTKFCKWTQGVGFIDVAGPRFIPFEN